MYPEANIWLTGAGYRIQTCRILSYRLLGHSLGGALASLVGVTFGIPVVAFESPGEKMAAGRLHLPSPVSTLFSSSLIKAFTRQYVSPRPSTSHMCIIVLTQSQWGPAPAFSQAVLWLDSPWRVGESHMHIITFLSQNVFFIRIERIQMSSGKNCLV